MMLCSNLQPHACEPRRDTFIHVMWNEIEMKGNKMTVHCSITIEVLNKYQLEAPTIFIEIVISPSKARSIRNAKSKATKS